MSISPVSNVSQLPPYFRPPNSGPDCSTRRSARLRERRFQMGYEHRTEPPEYAQLAAVAARILRETEVSDTALARALAMRQVVEQCDITLERDALLLGGENPFFFNLLLPALQQDRFSREGGQADEAAAERMRQASLMWGPCFGGHITPGLEYILGQGISGIRARAAEHLRTLQAAGAATPEQEQFYQAALLSCENILCYARRYRDAALREAEQTADPAWAEELRQAAEVLAVVPEYPAETLHQALQAYWLVYILVTTEMGGCNPGGGIGLGRMDQYFYPYYQRDLAQGRLTHAQALELMELFLLNFRHVDYYTGHQPFTPGSQACLGGITATGMEASNALSELIMEASLRIAMPAPYISLRLHPDTPERFWHAATNYICGGLGFPIVNDTVLIPAMLRHGRSLSDARDYICSCCYEHTIPGREAFHPSGSILNLPLLLELALNGGRSLSGELLGQAGPAWDEFTSFSQVLDAFTRQLHYVSEKLVGLVNAADAAHMRGRRYPMMSLFIDDCLGAGRDVCAGGARYNLTGCIMVGLPNVLNALAAIRTCVFEQKTMSMGELSHALSGDFAGEDALQRQLLAAPKWGNGDERVDDIAAGISEKLYAEFSQYLNARGGRWQAALYSFIFNLGMGQAVGASADGRRARQPLTRNLNPTRGTDAQGPTAILRSLSHIDFSEFPNGSALDLRFDPAIFSTENNRAKFAAFLKAFVELGVMEMQISMVDTESLHDARAHPERHPHLMVRVAGYSARFIDLPPQEQDEIIGRSLQRM